MEFTIADRIEVHELIALYGHIIDDRQFSRLGEIFTTDSIFDLTEYDGTKYNGLDEIMSLMTDSDEHPLAHHASNIVVSVAGNIVSAISKGIGVGHQGRVGSVVYRDKLTHAVDGWRITERRVALRSLEHVPPIS